MSLSILFITHYSIHLEQSICLVTLIELVCEFTQLEIETFLASQLQDFYRRGAWINILGRRWALLLSNEISGKLAFLGFLWWKNQFFQDRKQSPYELAETCMEEPVSHGLMQKPWQLRPQVASNVHLVRFAMSGVLICISLKWRPLIYMHQTLLFTNIK